MATTDRLKTTWPSSRPRVDAVPVQSASRYHGGVTVYLDRWVAQEGACLTCSMLGGEVLQRGFGPEPPLHRHCRCRRVPAGWIRYGRDGRVIARGSS